VPVLRPHFQETTCLGACLAAGLGAGVLTTEQIFSAHSYSNAKFTCVRHRCQHQLNLQAVCTCNACLCALCVDTEWWGPLAEANRRALCRNDVSPIRGASARALVQIHPDMLSMCTAHSQACCEPGAGGAAIHTLENRCHPLAATSAAHSAPGCLAVQECVQQGGTARTQLVLRAACTWKRGLDHVVGWDSVAIHTFELMINMKCVELRMMNSNYGFLTVLCS
jgi:hypothetical protein